MSADCQHNCPEGRPCACGGRPHSLHVCGNEGCACHAQERYRREGSKVRYVRYTLRRGAVRVVLDKGAPGGAGWLEVER